MTVQTCYGCGHQRDVDHDEPGRCLKCGTWNQSERFKAEIRASLDARGRSPQPGREAERPDESW